MMGSVGNKTGGYSIPRMPPTYLQAAPMLPIQKNSARNWGKYTGKSGFVDLCSSIVFGVVTAVFDPGPGRGYIGFPDPVGITLIEYEPEPNHLDPIHCTN